MNSILKQIRNNLGLSQKEVSTYLGIPLRTIQNWEEGTRVPNEFTLNMVIEKLLEKNQEHTFSKKEGVYSFSLLKKKISELAVKYNISKVILFGSYSKGYAKPTSDIDLVITTDITGLAFFGMLDDFVTTLNKDVDLIREKDILMGSLVDKEIKQTGVIIYENRKD